MDSSIDTPKTPAPKKLSRSILPDEESKLSTRDRLALLSHMMGDVPPWANAFADVVRDLVNREYDKHVQPLFEKFWPEALGNADGRKLHFLTCNLYASAPYTVLFCSKKRPFVLAVAARMGSALRLSPNGLAKAAQLALNIFGRFALKQSHRRIVSISAFIAVIDHAFDHCMDDDAEERGRKIRGLVDGTWTPDTGPLKLVRAIQEAMSEGLNKRDEEAFQLALSRVIEWCESEVKGMTGVPDPLGLCHRMAGVEGTIDGLIFPVNQYAGESAREWMYGVSLFVQMMDDWIDYEQDLADVRATPVIEGTWRFADVEDKWRETTQGIQNLAHESGLTSDAYQTFVRDAYVLMMREVMEAMAGGLAA